MLPIRLPTILQEPTLHKLVFEASSRADFVVGRRVPRGEVLYFLCRSFLRLNGPEKHKVQNGALLGK